MERRCIYVENTKDSADDLCIYIYVYIYMYVLVFYVTFTRKTSNVLISYEFGVIC